MKIRVLVIDDSALMRRALTAMLATDPDIEVVGTAPDPYIAREKIKALDPDVLTLDVEMPRMDGLEFLEKLMRARPTPVVMVSSFTEAGCQTTLRALELGAVDFVTKPRVNVRERLEEVAGELTEKVKVAATARLGPRRPGAAAPAPASRRPLAGAIGVIGASTGGPEALRRVLGALPATAPALVVVQHMPERFTRAFADRLDGLCAVRVAEAADGDRVLPGHVLIAPGNHHLRLVRDERGVAVQVGSDAPVNRHRPSVDVLFESAATVLGAGGLGVLLTGMGQDGARGLLRMRQAGARTAAQDPETCIVAGMPGEAIRLGAAERVEALDDVAGWLMAQVPEPESVVAGRRG